jgi:heme O synthase-like polyprenyltransferase
MSASRKRKEVTTLTKARLIYLLLIASLFAYMLACARPGLGMSSGGGW